MADETRISPSKREIYTKLLDIAEKYTDVKDSDFLKTGLFGYITESMAMIMRDSSYQKTMLYNEFFLNTAIIPKSIYNWAKMFKIDIQKATPAYADIEMKINRESLLAILQSINNSDIKLKKFGLTPQHSKYEIAKNSIILNKEDPIYAGDYAFSLENSIIIYLDNNNSIKAQYISKFGGNEYTSTNYQKELPLYLTVRTDGDGLNVIINTRAYQYETLVYTRQIPSSTFLNKVQTFEFENQFCGANLFYIQQNETTQITLNYSEISASGANAAFYNLNDENHLEITFKYGNGFFMPTANSQLKAVIYSTKGANVPASFSGDAYMMISDNDLKTLPLVINFNPTNIIGGKNAPTLNDIKTTIINEISTRKTITTQNDLNRYFAIITSLIEDINDGKVIFKKQRDDVLRRTYNAYLLLRDNIDDSSESFSVAGSNYLSSCAPTNTINVVLPESEFSSSFSSFKDTPETDAGLLLYTKASDSSETGKYICPFLINVVPESNSICPFVQLIYNLVNEDLEISYKTSIDSTEGDFYSKNRYFVPKAATLKRGFSDNLSSLKGNDNYELKLVFNTDFPLGVSETNESSENVYTFTGGITLNFSKNGTIGNLIFTDTAIECTYKELEDSSYDVSFIINIPVNSSEFTVNSSDYSYLLNLTDNTNSIQIPDSVDIELNMNGLQVQSLDGDTFNLGNNFIIKDVIFFQNMDDIIDLTLGSESSYLQVEDTTSTPTEGKIYYTESEGTYTAVNSAGTNLQTFISGTSYYEKNIYYFINELPVIHSSFFNNIANSSARKEGFTKQLFTYISVLKENLSRLETSTFFNLKFFNTYGPSFMYTTPRTNLSLEMKITLVDTISETNKNGLEQEMKAYIRKIIDKMNNENKISISKLISILSSDSTYGSYIEHIEFIGLNDSFEQVIESIESDNNATITPEWLNIQPESLNNITFG